VAIYLVTATLLLRWDLRSAGIKVSDFHETLYALFTQLTFQPTAPFPPTPLSRAIFWLTPLAGVFLLAEGLLKVGASLFDSDARRQAWVTIMTSQMHKHVIVCGLGHVGYRVVKELLALGEDVVAIEHNEKDSFVDKVRAKGVPVHVGDARRDDLLEEVGIKRAKAVVCATSDDLANLEVALDAKRMNPGIRVVMRMFDQRLAGKVGGALDLDQIFSTSALAAPLIAIQATQIGVRSAYRLDDTVRVTAEITVRAGAPETTVAQIEERSPCRVVTCKRASEETFSAARASDKVFAEDVLIVDTTAVDLPAVRYQLGG
jgi:Trk K+ transport system NAD-binding subunit